jgi:hypothetical protein
MSLPSPNSQKLTATNFDLPSLHLLRPEIAVTLHDAEMHLSEFNDDSSQAPLLLDSVDTLAQLAKVLRLIQLEEGYELANSLSAGLQKLYDERERPNNDMMMDVSEGIMTLARYIEFVLLKETIEPSLLLPIINQLHGQVQIGSRAWFLAGFRLKYWPRICAELARQAGYLLNWQIAPNQQSENH